nr:hypothetical protein [uncultured Azospirillum sp.]
MHAKFNLDARNENWNKYIELGKEVHNENKRKVKGRLDEFRDANGILRAKDIVDDLFPMIDSDVFISHSHEDESLAVGFSGWLKSEFGILSFVDSLIWEHSDNILKEIDGKHCVKERDNKGNIVYNYNARNKSTGHVHAMVLNALVGMIDRCECLIFLNTDHSFKPSDYISGKGSTKSPWIYSEIAMARTIRQRTVSEHRGRNIRESVATEGKSADIREVVDYELDVLHLTPLSTSDLRSWCEISGRKARGIFFQSY